MRAATVVRAPDGSIRVDWASHSPAAVFVDRSPNQGGLWARGYPRSAGVERSAAQEFVATAVRAVAAVAGGPSGGVNVIGEGLLARLVQRLLPASFDAERPWAVIEATGSDSNVREAIGTVEVLGTVVLAAPVDARVIEVAAYTDIHLRGRTVVGVPWATAPTDARAELVDWALACLARAGDGDPEPSSPWFRCGP